MDENTSQGGTCTEMAASASSPWSMYFFWPIFLACSWTWVIGMYLPILLRDRYGWMGVIAFAVPNVLGIMLFGWGIKNIQQSRAFLRRHHAAAIWFSAVTVAFHAWFFGWFWTAELGLHPADSILIGLGFITLALITTGFSDRVFLWVSLLVYGFSLLVLILTVSQGWSVLTGDAASPRTLYWPRASSIAWIYLIPVMALGFLTCPYFDLTFHRAYQSVGGGKSGRITFLIFGPLFAVMITLTAIYAVTGYSVFIFIHLLVQGWLTTTLHLREIIKHTKPRRETTRARRMIQFPFIIVFLAPLPLIDYRDWFLFYGIIFPAIYLLRTLRRRVGLRESHAITITAAILFSVPFALAGFLTDHEWALLIPPFLFLLLSLTGRKRASFAH